MELVHISGEIVTKVIEYLKYHVKVVPRRIESPLKSTIMREIVDAFDAKFVDDVDQVLMLLCASLTLVRFRTRCSSSCWRPTTWTSSR